MKLNGINSLKLGIAFAGALVLSACATSPDISEMQVLDKSLATDLLAGNTLTYKADYGRWAEYFDANSLDGRGKAWGSWGEEVADSATNISSEGEVCTIYTGDYEWSNSEHNFCFFIYQDAEGEVVLQSTNNTWKPERVGTVRKVQIETGDTYSLMN